MTGECEEPLDDVEEFELLPSRPSAEPFGVDDGLKFRSQMEIFDASPPTINVRPSGKSLTERIYASRLYKDKRRIQYYFSMIFFVLTKHSNCPIGLLMVNGELLPFELVLLFVLSFKSHIFTQPFPPVYICLFWSDIVTAQTTSPCNKLLNILVLRGQSGLSNASDGNVYGCKDDGDGDGSYESQWKE